MATSATPTQPRAPAEIDPRPSSSPDATPPPHRIHPSLFGDRLYRLSVEQYHRMAQAGALTEDDRVELIEGLLVRKMTKCERHISTTKLIVRAVEKVLPGGWHVAKEDPIVTARSEPEPDVAVLRGAIEDYFHRKPGPADVGLIVEVAESSYSDDVRKRVIYAEAGIPCYWIANLGADRVEVYTDPTGPDPAPDYRNRRDFGPGESVPLVLEGREVAQLAVDSLLAPRPR